MALQQTERQLQAACIQLLEWYETQGKLLFIRNNSFAGKIERRDGSKGYIKNNKPGAPDLIIFFKSGITLHAELKSLTGTLSPEQKVWQKGCKKLLHAYAIVRNFEHLERILKIYAV